MSQNLASNTQVFASALIAQLAASAEEKLESPRALRYNSEGSVFLVTNA